MAVTIQDGIVNAPNGASRRAIAATADGTLWACVYSDLATDRWEFWHSTDDGSTWTENSSLRITTSVGSEPFAFAINTVNDIAVFRGDGVNVKVVYGLTTSASAWTDAGASSDIATAQFCDMVVFNKPGSSNFFVATIYDNGTTDRMSVMEFTSAGAFVSEVESVTLGADGTGSVDFNHNGDGNTVAGSAPHLYVSYLNSSTLYPSFRKFTYSAGTWSTGSERTLLANAADDTNTSLVFDGARAIIVAADSNAADVFERDAGDTTTTNRSGDIPASPGGVTAIRVSANGTTGFDVYELDEATDDIDYVTFTRSGASWGSFTEFVNYANGLTAAGWSVSKHKVGSIAPSVWLVDDGTNYDLDTDNRSYNVAPNAPTWVSPSDNSGADVGAALTLDWDFSDDDAGDTQSAYALQRVVDGGSTEWWSVAGGTWTTETKNTSSTSALTLSSSWGSDGESHVFKVKTWDAADVEGPLSAALTVIASTPATPTITAPATSATLTGPTATVTWTVSEQTAYRVRILNSSDVQLYSTGKVASTATSVVLSGYNLANGLTGLKFELTTWNNEDLSASDTNTGIAVTYTAPLTPTLAVAANDAGGYITVTITDPTPSGTPTVSYHDVYVRVASGGRQDGERTVNDDGIRIATNVTSGSYVDYAAASGVSYEYRTLAVADTGATAYSAWT